MRLPRIDAGFACLCHAAIMVAAKQSDVYFRGFTAHFKGERIFALSVVINPLGLVSFGLSNYSLELLTGPPPESVLFGSATKSEPPCLILV